MFVIYKRLTAAQRRAMATTVQEWFAAHSRRRVCHVSVSGLMLAVRRTHVAADIRAMRQQPRSHKRTQ